MTQTSGPLSGPPGMSLERWELYKKELALAQGEEVSFTPAEIELLRIEAEHANKVLSPEELRDFYGPDIPDPDVAA